MNKKQIAEKIKKEKGWCSFINGCTKKNCPLHDIRNPCKTDGGALIKAEAYLRHLKLKANKTKMTPQLKKILKGQKELNKAYDKTLWLLNKKITLMEKQIKLFKGGE